MSHALYVFKVKGADDWMAAKEAVADAIEEAGDENNWYTILETHVFESAAVYGPPRADDAPAREYHDEAWWDRFATSLMVFDLLSAAPMEAGGVSAYFTPEEHRKRVEELTDGVVADRSLFFTTAVEVAKAILSQPPDGERSNAPYSHIAYNLEKAARALSMYPDTFPWKEGAYTGDFYQYRTFLISDAGDSGLTFVVTADIHT